MKTGWYDKCDRCGAAVISDDECAYVCWCCGHMDIGVGELSEPGYWLDPPCVRNIPDDLQ